MSLSNSYLVSSNRIPEFFDQIKDGQAPERVTQQLLKDWGFSSTNNRAFIPLLKSLGFLSAEGKPTQRYHDFRDHSKSAAVLGQAIREAYGDIFLIKENPNESDRAAIKGKFKSFHNVSDNVAGLMTKTFFSLLTMADMEAPSPAPTLSDSETATEPETPISTGAGLSPKIGSGLHYNIQIHLPPTKDIEVYNAIFKSLRTHLGDE